MGEPGLRERKKQRTRQLLADAAMRLFEQQGYEETTVAEIAAAADMSVRTFFVHFPSKDDVFFASSDDGVEAALRAVADRGVEDGPLDVLVRAVERMSIAHPVAVAQANDIGPLRLRLLNSVPSLQARALHRLAEAQQRLAEAMHDTYPDRVDQVTSAAAVGALVGAVVSTTMACLATPETEIDLQAALRRAIDVAVHGIAPAFG